MIEIIKTHKNNKLIHIYNLSIINGNLELLIILINPILDVIYKLLYSILVYLSNSISSSPFYLFYFFSLNSLSSIQSSSISIILLSKYLIVLISIPYTLYFNNECLDYENCFLLLVLLC